MSTDEQTSLAEISVDKTSLYREEIVTDLKVATMRHLVPIKADGSRDDSRPAVYIGQTQILSQHGPLPVQAEIEAESLEAALDQFPDAIQEAVERLVDEVKEMQRQQAGRIITPGSGGAAPGGLIPPGGMRGGGGIIA